MKKIIREFIVAIANSNVEKKYLGNNRKSNDEIDNLNFYATFMHNGIEYQVQETVADETTTLSLIKKYELVLQHTIDPSNEDYTKSEALLIKMLKSPRLLRFSHDSQKLTSRGSSAVKSRTVCITDSFIFAPSTKIAQLILDASIKKNDFVAASYIEENKGVIVFKHDNSPVNGDRYYTNLKTEKLFESIGIPDTTKYRECLAKTIDDNTNTGTFLQINSAGNILLMYKITDSKEKLKNDFNTIKKELDNIILKLKAFHKSNDDLITKDFIQSL